MRARSTLAALLIAGLVMGGDAPSGRFDREVAGFATADRSAMPSSGGIVFTGASGIRRWSTLAEDFAGLPVINRAIGGSYTAELTQYLDRLILPYLPRCVVLQPGSNDLNAGRSPEQVRDDLRTFVETLRARLPQVRIVYLGINPSPKRWHLREVLQRTNQLISDYLATVPQTRFVDLWPSTLGADGLPKPEWFIADQLHPSRIAYRERSTLIRPALE